VTHLVVGEAERQVASVVALEAAGISFRSADPGQVMWLEPVSSCGLGGWTARFCEESDERFAAVVLVSPPMHLPWLDPGLLDWEAGHPVLVADMLAPGLANLYIVGLDGSDSLAAGGELLIAMIEAQAGLEHPLVDEIMRFVAPSHEPRPARVLRRLERRLQRRAATGASSWWEAAHEPDGPLTAARSI